MPYIVTPIEQGILYVQPIGVLTADDMSEYLNILQSSELLTQYGRTLIDYKD